ncbi:MAG: polymorphic toxin-type HINT domain-containing protein [Pirellulaceae bacterium]
MDVELIRPRLWLQAFDISVGKPLPLNIHELQIEGFALVTAIEPCPAISSGEGSVVTGRFVTRQVHRTIRLVVADSTGQTETIEGTAIHPFWSLDRLDWVPIGDLNEGETLSGREGPVTVLSSTLFNHPVPVYNIEVNGEHVYEVSAFELLVHNSCVVNDVLNESANAIGKITSTFKLNGDEVLLGALKWLQSGYREIGKSGSGVFLSKDGLRRFRMDPNSLLGKHPPFIPHVHFEWLDNLGQVMGNNHVPIF